MVSKEQVKKDFKGELKLYRDEYQRGLFSDSDPFCFTDEIMDGYHRDLVDKRFYSKNGEYDEEHDVKYSHYFKIAEQLLEELELELEGV